MHQTLSDHPDTEHTPLTEIEEQTSEAELERWRADASGLSFKAWRVREVTRRAEECASGIVAIHWQGTGGLQGELDAKLRAVLVRYSVLRSLGHRRSAAMMMVRFERKFRMGLRARRLSDLRRLVLSKCRRTRTTRSTRRTTTRTHRTATKKAAATSTGDPDPEPSSDARARLRSVALIEPARVGGGL